MKNELNLFRSTDYREYVREKVKAMPHGGRGQFRKIAQFLDVHSTLISQVFRGEKHLTSEQAMGVSDYFGHNALEMEYFLNLVLLERSGTPRARKFHEGKLKELRQKAKNPGERLNDVKELNEEQKAIYYSNWMYTAILCQTDVEGFGTIEALAEYFDLPHKTVRQIVDFLLETKICIRKKNVIKPGSTYTHLAPDSPHVIRHHSNWRLQAIQHLPRLSSEELAYTCPMAISKEHFQVFRERFFQAIVETVKEVETSPPELTACLNLDFFKI